MSGNRVFAPMGTIEPTSKLPVCHCFAEAVLAVDRLVVTSSAEQWHAMV